MQCAPRDLTAPPPRHRSAECAPDSDRARRAAARSDEGFAAQEAQLSPGAPQHVTGEDRRGMGVGAGVARLVSANPRVNMRAVTDLAGELRELVRFYQDETGHLRGTLSGRRAVRASLQSREGVLSTARASIETTLAREAAWEGLEAEARRVRAMFDAVGAIADLPGAVIATAGVIRDAIEAFEGLVARVLAFDDELGGAIARDGASWLDVARGGRLAADVAFTVGAAAAGIYAAPAAGLVTSGGAAPSVLSPLAHAGRAMVAGSVFEGVGEAAGTQLGGLATGAVDGEAVREAAWDGMKSGALRGAMAVVGGGVRDAASRVVVPLVDGAPAVARTGAALVTGAVSGAGGGALVGGARASLEGASRDGVVAGALNGAARGAATSGLRSLAQ